MQEGLSQTVHSSPDHEFGWEIIGDLIQWKRMKALIFDLDATLVDSVYAHVLAWQETVSLPDGKLITSRRGQQVTAPVKLSSPNPKNNVL
jgi:hypothetical protein